MITSSPIPYVRNAKLCGSCFDPEGTGCGIISNANTGFWVDHREPRDASAEARRDGKWHLGELGESHEFVVMLVKRNAITA